MIKFRGKVEELNSEMFIRIPDDIVKEYNLKIDETVGVTLQKVK